MLIAFEGIDGSGKATQAKLLVDRLTDHFGEEWDATGAYSTFKGVSLYSFPDYDTESGQHLKRYLKGDMGPLGSNDPFLVSLLYAFNRYQHRDQMKHLMEECGTLIVCDRYVGSNLAHQGANERSEARRAKLLQYIDAAEHGELALPRPDLVILLDLTAEQSFRRTHARDDEPDLHQDSLDYMDRVRQVYLGLGDTYTAWRLVACVDADGKDRSVEDIHAEIWQIVASGELGDRVLGHRSYL